MLIPNNKATAIVSIGYYDGKDTHFFEGRIDGTIVTPRGDDRFAWDLIFMPNGYDKTFAEMSIEDKNKISMRKIAINKFKEHFLKK
jgi:non-canonical purine NTP pyrophosphatase (RdgB/HAM1 family)